MRILQLVSMRGLRRRKLREQAHHGWIVLQEAAAAFLRNDDLRQASSLAFYTALALIPALLLLTAALGFAIGSSQTAMQKTGEFLGDVLPRSATTILKEVGALSRARGATGILNLAVLLWSLTPLVAALRSVLNGIFKVRPSRPFWLNKLLDLAMALCFILGLAFMAGSGVLLKALKKVLPGLVVPSSLGTLLPFVMTILLLFGIYAVLAPRVKVQSLMAGALVTALLWFMLRPAFSLFLTYNTGYGFTFGSFKSIFIVIVWLYYSMAVLLFGAEVVAALHRGEAVLIKRLMEGRGALPLLGRRRFLLEVPAGRVFFQENEPGREMYHVLKGSVSIRKGDRELAQIGPGAFFGEMSFLLGAPRSASAVAMEPCTCVMVNEQNMDALMREYPGTVHDMLVILARRLKETSERTSEA